MKEEESLHTQIDDMLDRKVAKRLTEWELKQYKGPIYYVSRHEITKPQPDSIPCRVVYNSSANYKGQMLLLQTI